jgi:hypothetical protein
MNPFLDPSHPLEYIGGREIGLEGVTMVEKKARPVMPALVRNAPRASDLVWQKKTAGIMRNRAIKKADFTYQASLHQIGKLGFERHPLPGEYLELFATMDVERESGDFEDIAKGAHEWTDLAFEIDRRDTLTVYWHPRNLHYSESRYVWNGVPQHEGKKEYDLGEIERNAWHVIDKLPERLVVDLFGRHYEDLSPLAQSTKVLILPLKDDKVFPVSIIQRNWQAHLAAGRNMHAVSRGVKRRAQ